MAYNKFKDYRYELVDKRYVGKGLIANSRTSDGTSDLRTQLESLVMYAGEDGFPSKYTFSITNNKNLKTTARNQILSIELPIIPPIFDPNPYDANKEANYNQFLYKNRSYKDRLENPNVSPYNSVQEIHKIYEQLSETKRNEYIQTSADLLVSYVLGEIGLSYIRARENNDKETMKQLKSLDVLEEEGFDLDMFDLVMRTPGGLKINGDEATLTLKENGKDVTYSLDKNKISDYKLHQHFRAHCLDAGRYFAQKFSEDLQRYPEIDINRARYFPIEPGE